MKNNRGFVIQSLVVLIALILIGGGIYFVKNEEVTVPIEIPEPTTIPVPTVTSTPPPQASPLLIISPNGGEIWVRGSTQKITWKSPQYIRATFANLTLVPYQPQCTTQICSLYMLADYPIAKGISINQNLYSWKVGDTIDSSTEECDPIQTNTDKSTSSIVCGTKGGQSSIPPGQYKMQICEVGTSVCDLGDKYFTITK